MAGKIQKATSEYDAQIVHDWNAFCEANGFAQGQATQASCVAFMKSLSPEEREIFMSHAIQHGWFEATQKREVTQGRSGSARAQTPPFKPFPR